MTARVWLLAVSSAVALTACSSGPKPARFTQTDNGRVTTLGLGREAVLTLNTLWNFRSVSGRAVRPLGPERLVFPKRGCPALVGCGTVTLRVKAVARGRSVILAMRGSCGEAERCLPDQRRYMLTVVVR